jgi:hypothetical protein
MKLERMRQPLAPQREFYRRMASSALLALVVIGGSLIAGILGYHVWCRLSWIDSLANASMILGGMGPLDPVTSRGGKIFESAYALYSGVALLTSVGVLFAPAVHRFLHAFHLEDPDGEAPGPRARKRD